MNWDMEDCDPVADIQKAIEITKNDIGTGRPISFREALYLDAQQLYMMGYNTEQVNYYVKFMKEAVIRRAINNEKSI